MKEIILSIGLWFSVFGIKAQQIKVLTTDNKTSIRGMSVPDDNIIWVSGSNGKVGRSLDGGNIWQWIIVKDYEKRDFRDIEAFDANTAIIMAVAEPAVILKTKDGGQHWYKVFEDSTKGMFLDAMDFDGQNGIIIGDPLDENIFMASTTDKGESWRKWHGVLDVLTVKEKGEAFFASSGTNIKSGKSGMFFVSGGKQSNIYNWEDIAIQEIPITKGTNSTGANSIDIYKNKGIIVGGDFAKDTISKNNCSLFTYYKEKFTFKIPQTPPHGYRSCVIYINENKLITCGTSGVDISNDGGMNWQLISNESFHVVQKAKKGNAVYLAGAKGRVAQIIF